MADSNWHCEGFFCKELPKSSAHISYSQHLVCLYQVILVVATDYGGNTDFVKEQTAYPVPYKLVEAKSDIPAYDFVSKWAQPDIDAAVTFLQRIYNNKDEVKQKVTKAKNFIERNYSAENFRNDLLAFLAI